jgi:ABC-type branched-subunit amino acid transport system ATPase component
MSLLRVDELEAGYARIRILNNICFDVGDGEFLGVLGHNGMGKSTLLKAISGSIKSMSGSIKFADREISGLQAHLRARAGIGYVPQGRQIFANLSARENLMMAALGTGRPPEIVDRVLAQFPRLEPIADRAGGVLSGGEQQILAIARCLCGEPRLLLLDEPTEGVQPSIRDEIVDTLRNVREKFGLTVLLVEQNVEFMRSLVDRVLTMEKGRLEIQVDHNLEGFGAS